MPAFYREYGRFGRKAYVHASRFTFLFALRLTVNHTFLLTLFSRLTVKPLTCLFKYIKPTYQSSTYPHNIRYLKTSPNPRNHPKTPSFPHPYIFMPHEPVTMINMREEPRPWRPCPLAPQTTTHLRKTETHNHANPSNFRQPAKISTPSSLIAKNLAQLRLFEPL